QAWELAYTDEVNRFWDSLRDQLDAKIASNRAYVPAAFWAAVAMEWDLSVAVWCPSSAGSQFKLQPHEQLLRPQKREPCSLFTPHSGGTRHIDVL
ncbi:unnamed protein product, partial [Chrysoparadoxa australica]